MHPQLNASQIPVTSSYSRIGAPVVTRIQLVYPHYSQGVRHSQYPPQQQHHHPQHSQWARHPQYDPQQVYPQYFKPSQQLVYPHYSQGGLHRQQVYWYGDPQQVRTKYSQGGLHRQQPHQQYAPQQEPQNAAQVQEESQKTTSTRGDGSSRSIEVNSSPTKTVSPTQPNLEKIISSLKALIERITPNSTLHNTLVEHLKSIQSNTDPERALKGLNTTLSKMVATNDPRNLTNNITFKEQQYRQLCENYRLNYSNDLNLSDEEKVNKQQALRDISSVLEQKKNLITNLEITKLLDDVKHVLNYLHDLKSQASTPESKTPPSPVHQPAQQELGPLLSSPSIQQQVVCSAPQQEPSEPQNVASLEQVQQAPQKPTRGTRPLTPTEVKSTTTKTVSLTSPHLKKIIPPLEKCIGMFPSDDALKKTLTQYLENIKSNTNVEDTLDLLKETLSPLQGPTSLDGLRTQIFLLREYALDFPSYDTESEFCYYFNSLINLFRQKVLQRNIHELLSAVENGLNHLHDLKNQAATPESKTITEPKGSQEKNQQVVQVPAPQQVPQQAPQKPTRDARSLTRTEVKSTPTKTVSPTQPNLEKIISSLKALIERITPNSTLHNTLVEHLKSIQSNTAPERALNGLNTTLSKMVAANNDVNSLTDNITLKEQQYRQLCENYRLNYSNTPKLSDEKSVEKRQALGVISEVINEKEDLTTRLKTINLLDDVNIACNHLHDLKSQASTPESTTSTVQQEPQHPPRTSIEVQSTTTKSDPMKSERRTRENTPENLREIQNVKINKLLNDLKSYLRTLPSSEINDTLIDNIDTILSALKWEVECYDSDEASMTDALKTQPNFLINLKKLAGLLPAGHPTLAMIEDLRTLLEEQPPDDSVLSAASTPNKTDTPRQNPAIKSDVIDPLDQFIKSSLNKLLADLNRIETYAVSSIQSHDRNLKVLDQSQLDKLKRIFQIVHSLRNSYSQDDYSSFFFKKGTIKKLETLQTLLPKTSVNNFLALYRFTAYESPNVKSLDTFTSICIHRAQFFSSVLSLSVLSLLQNHIKKNTTIEKAIDTIRRKPFLSCDRDMTSAMQTLNKVVEIKTLPLYIELKLQPLLNAYNLIKALSESGFSEEQLKQLFPEENYQLRAISE